MISIKIQRPRLTKKLAIFIACGLAGLLLLGGLVWWLLSQKATGDYHNARTNFNQAASRALGDVTKEFQAASDYDKRIAALGKLAETASKWKDTRPELPTMLGISLVTKEDKESQDTLIKQLEQLKTAASDAQELLKYEHTVVATLGEVKDKSGKNAEEQKALAAAWLAMLNKLKAMSVPGAAKTVHADMLGRISNVQAAMAALPDLYAKKDTNGFTTKQSELSKYFDAVKSLSDSYIALANTQDTYLAKAYDSALKTLK